MHKVCLWESESGCGMDCGGKGELFPGRKESGGICVRACGRAAMPVRTVASGITGTLPHGPRKGSPVYNPPLSSGAFGGTT